MFMFCLGYYLGYCDGPTDECGGDNNYILKLESIINKNQNEIIKINNIIEQNGLNIID